MKPEPVMTLPSGETIREGDFAITRDGQKVGPFYVRWPQDFEGDIFGIFGDGRLWNYSGKCWKRHDADLIAKWHPVEAGHDPVKPPKRDLRTIDEPFGELDARTQKRLRKAAERGWPVQLFGVFKMGWQWK